MTAQVEQFLKSFDVLSEAEKHEAAVALLGRIVRDAPPTLSDEALVAAAEELFLELDANEAGASGQP
jgi:hypothetical protein